MGRKPVTKPFAIRLPAALHQQLRREADKRMVSVNYLILKAVTQFLETLPPTEEKS
jgi:predicted HicB family RNase H-like nuclease